MADLAHYITDYGYWALFIGCLAEGETITLLGGIAAHQGLLHLPWVIAVVALGGTLGDQVLFFLGRHFGGRVISRLKSQEKRIERARKLIARHPMLFVIGVRFMYGFRLEEAIPSAEDYDLLPFQPNDNHVFMLFFFHY